MPTKEQIITALYTGKNFNDCLLKMEPEYLREDLRQEIIMIVCEWPEEKIQKLHAEGALEFYVVRVILNQCQSNTSPFFKKYRQQLVPWAEYFRESVDFGTKTDGSAEYESNYTRRVAVRTAAQETQEHDERQLREQLEDYAIEQINNLYWYDKELILLYLEVGSFRAMEARTKIPYASCYKNIQKSLATLKRQATEKMKQPEPVFTKQELSTIPT